MLRYKNGRGDTIIEVLIAVTIAGLAIGTSYSIAHKSIQNAVSARERDQAVGLLESQITALKLREQKTDSATFASKFSYPQTHFCLDETASDPSANNWLPKANTASEPLQAGTNAPYNTACVRNSIYYLDITTTRDNTSSTPTNYRLDVRWPRIGGGPDNDTTFYYRF